MAFSERISSDSSGSVSPSNSKPGSHFTGVYLALTTGFLSTVISSLVKLINSIGQWETGVFGFGAITLCSVAMLALKRTNPFNLDLLKDKLWRLVFSGLFGSIGVGLAYYSVRNMPVGDSNVLSYSTPVYVAILACIFLREPISPLILVCILTTIGGSILVSKPEFLGFTHEPSLRVSNTSVLNDDVNSLATLPVYGNRLWGPLAGIVSAMSSAIDYCIIRGLKDVPHEIVSFYYNIILTLGFTLETILFDTWRWPGSQLPYVVALMIIYCFDILFLIRSFQLEQAAVVTLCRESVIIWSYLSQTLIFGTPPDWWSIAGALLVAVSIAVLNVDKLRVHRKQTRARRHSRTVEIPSEVVSIAGGEPDNAVEKQPLLSLRESYVRK